MTQTAHTTWALVACVLIAPWLTACVRSNPCGGVEACDRADNDCDGRIDEDFKDNLGRYAQPNHCGGCGVTCADVFPTASLTECVAAGETATCSIVNCPEGTILAGGACLAPEALPCGPCDEQTQCPTVTTTGDDGDPVRTVTHTCIDGRCEPGEGSCECNESNLNTMVSCIVQSPAGTRCAGTQTCAQSGFTACVAAFDETCNAQDDDCDGQVDENFRDGQGRYTSTAHCGLCGNPCVSQGPNLVATCTAQNDTARCESACAAGFVDVDGIVANGCECELWDGQGPPPAVGGDTNCDGIPDDSATFIHVRNDGNDANPGTLLSPVRTVAQGQVLGLAANKPVLVASGAYNAGLQVTGGVSVFGGYRNDFQERDLELYPVTLTNEVDAPGAPVLTCQGVGGAGANTIIDGLTVRGSDAVNPSDGSTALYLNDCGPEVILQNITVLAARGANGEDGTDSEDNLSTLGVGSLSDLSGTDGTAGSDGANAGCPTVSGGEGGDHTCGALNVSGGDGASAGCPNLGCTNGTPCGNAGCADFTANNACDFDQVFAAAVANAAPEPGQGPGPGAAGAVSYSAPTNRGVCNFCEDNPVPLRRDGDGGGDGASGVNGPAGFGCSATPVLNIATGRMRAGAGTDGLAGTHGAGGGGGSTGSGYAVIGGTIGTCVDRSGGAGGGGGSGGCGAPQATGGTGGGASVGIIIRLTAGATGGPQFSGVRVVTAKGGNGGDGGVGASGGGGGTGGAGGTATFWCARNGGRGGDGGNGGDGGGGGGGCGGPSHGWVLVGGQNATAYANTLEANLRVDLVSVPSAAGSGGFSPGNSGTPGQPGSATAFAVFP